MITQLLLLCKECFDLAYNGLQLELLRLKCHFEAYMLVKAVWRVSMNFQARIVGGWCSTRQRGRSHPYWQQLFRQDIRNGAILQIASRPFSNNGPHRDCAFELE
jgi:hypothetical protein